MSEAKRAIESVWEEIVDDALRMGCPGMALRIQLLGPWRFFACALLLDAVILWFGR